MNSPDLIKEFFDGYAKATRSLDLVFFGSAYGESFLFASPGGAQAIKREDFLKVIPRRAEFFKASGLVASEVSRLEETPLDANHTMVKVYWSLRFEKGGNSIVDEIAATYVLRRQPASWQIVFQLDHQDLAKRAQELGLITPSS